MKHKENRKFHHMDIDMLEEIAKQIGSWLVKKRIEIVARGEALLHPKIFTALKLLRKHAPLCQFQISTNGIKFKNLEDPVDYVRRLYDAGLNILVVDDYDNTALLTALGHQAHKEFGVQYSNYYSDKSINPYTYHSHKIKAYVLVPDIGTLSEKTRTTRKLHNVAGNVDWAKTQKLGMFPITKPLEMKCVKPFREIVIQYNGVIPLCCNDYRRELVLAKFPEDGTLEEIWESKPFIMVRHLLFNKRRFMAPCYKCDFNGGFRQGFLKDPFNKPPNKGAIAGWLLRHRLRYEQYIDPNVKDPLFYKHKPKGSFL